MEQRDAIDIIAIAQGIVMHQRRICAADAALVLFATADQQARPLVDVAVDLVERRHVPHR